MHLIFHIFQGMGIAAAVGIRPFLPSLAVGALAAGNVEIDFNHTGFHFLESVPFLLAMAILTIALVLIEQRLTPARLERPPALYVLGAAALVLAALQFAGALAHGHDTPWPGYIGGVICCLIGILATRPLLARVRARLDAGAAAALPAYAEGVAVLFAVLSVVAAPLGLIGVLLLVWLLLASRRRAEQKYAGLRILR